MTEADRVPSISAAESRQWKEPGLSMQYRNVTVQEDKIE